MNNAKVSAKFTLARYTQLVLMTFVLICVNVDCNKKDAFLFIFSCSKNLQTLEDSRKTLCFFFNYETWNLKVYNPIILDPRIVKVKSNRSINLALSHRGREALRYVGLEDVILSQATPMKGRLVHFRSGKNKSFLYDKHNNQVNNLEVQTYISLVLLLVYLFNLKELFEQCSANR